MPSNDTPTFNAILKQVTSLYNIFIPNTVKYRKNIHLAKQPDTISLWHSPLLHNFDWDY